MFGTDEKTIQRLRMPIREDAVCARVPRVAFDYPALAERDRFRCFALLCACAAERSGIVFINGGLGYVEKGCLISTIGALGDFWGTTKGSARRTLEALRRVGLVGVHDTMLGQYVDTMSDEDTPPKSKGQVLAIRGLADDALVDETR